LPNSKFVTTVSAIDKVGDMNFVVAGGTTALWRKGIIPCAGILLSILAAGCPAQLTGSRQPEPTLQPAAISKLKAETTGAANGAVIQISFQEPSQEEKSGAAEPKEKITLPLAIQLCITQNFRLRAGAEKVRQAEAELITASLIPNTSLFADYQLIPLQQANIQNQLGPPQADVMLTIPIDWLVFGKRVAQMQAARLGVDVTNADYADQHRLQVGRTVDAFYEVLADEEFLKLAEKNHEELLEVEKATEELVKNKKAGNVEQDRIKLAVLEAFLEIHERERTLAGAKARLRPLIGRSATDPDFELGGVLTVTAVVPAPKLTDALSLADANRPDLISDQHEIAQAQAFVELERRKAKPQVSVIPGWSYLNQHDINGFRNGSMFDIGVSTTLPFTDRNQGNILKARAREHELRHDYLGNRADALAEVEATLANYEDAVEDVTQNNSPATLKAAEDLHKNMMAAYQAGNRKLSELLLAHQAYRERVAHVVEFESTYWRTLNKLNMVVGLNAYDQQTGATLRVGEGEKMKK
jgi:cobalt-zinc-cadmium efflux system outer membrane protein